MSTSVGDWDYQNLLPKPPYNLGLAPSQKFFSDWFLTDFTATTRITGTLYFGFARGSRAGRFNKDLYYSPTATHGGFTARCAITSP